MTTPIPYIPGKPRTNPGPLARYLPDVPEGVVTSWLDKYVGAKPRDKESPRLIDPFGTSPQAVIEAAQQGYLVIVTAVNPIIRLILRVLADPPTEADLKAVIASLGASYKGSERLEPHIKRLYETSCKNCSQTVSAEAFIWDRELKIPIKRIYTCPYCNDSGEYPTDQADIEKATEFNKSALYRARALERVAPLDDPERDHASGTLEMYTHRALYAITSLINKLDSFPSEGDQNLKALLLAIFDRANNLWHYPAIQSRPRQLVIPSQYYEHNIWMILENSITDWASTERSNPVPLAIWPEMSMSNGGICLFEGRFKELTELLSKQESNFNGIMMVPPRPNQAFWSLSALWAGWLFGHQNGGSLKGAFHRRRYDWGWHTSAMYSAASQLKVISPPKLPILTLICELEPSFLTSAFISNSISSLVYLGTALRVASGNAQMHWQVADQQDDNKDYQLAEDLDQISSQIFEDSAVDYLHKRREPAHFIYLLAEGLGKTGSEICMYYKNINKPAEIYTRINQIIQRTFSASEKFIRFDSSEHSLDVGTWWLKEQPDPEKLSLSDRIEIECINYLSKRSSCTFQELDKSLCETFPGLMTPNRKYLELCAQSYTGASKPSYEKLTLRTQDSVQNRKNDIEEMRSNLACIAATLSLKVTVEGDYRILWKDNAENLYFAFSILTSAIIGPQVLPIHFPVDKHILVVPGSRTNLITYKTRKDPRLKLAVEAGLRFLKFRHLRRLAGDKQMTRTKFIHQIALDPLENKDPQLPLL